jgi:hypothetical protein
MCEYHRPERKNGQRFSCGPCCADCEHFETSDHHGHRCAEFPTVRIETDGDAYSTVYCRSGRLFRRSSDVTESLSDCVRRLKALKALKNPATQAPTNATCVRELVEAPARSQEPSCDPAPVWYWAPDHKRSQEPSPSAGVRRSLVVIVDGEPEPNSLLKAVKANLPCGTHSRSHV